MLSFLPPALFAELFASVTEDHGGYCGYKVSSVAFILRFCPHGEVES